MSGAQLVTADAFTPAVEAIFEEFMDECRDDILAAAMEAGAAGAEAARAGSPRDTGAYARGWSWEMEEAGGTGYYVRVFNRSKPSLTHLLELGHAEWIDGRDTGRRVPGTLHIAPAADAAARAFEEMMER
ncbi:HK97 gp10 family phage protein [uncultured Adlercreutzia sp.]|jgi:hypothetical protein|uniref:HK97 gp10 family phage protein n=1 Tax=uncultured Adlercreutzia sp. TaxID=875803 RepID=UPI0025F63F21|nr:HK97 gp10 family phage protein [uncultured Adlercreutzia sp.]